MRTIVITLIIFLLAGCVSSTPADQPGESIKTLNVVATTSILTDVVSQVAKENILLSTLLPVGTDPHSFEPTPQDHARVAEAELVFANGAGLEEFMDDLIESAGAANRVVDLSEGIQLKVQENGHEHATADPHVWTDPNNVKIWVRNIESALSEADPVHAAQYTTNADQYLAELEELDAWIKDRVAEIPLENRVILADHLLYGYFANEYGFTQVGAIVPGYSSLAEPTARELAQIEDIITEHGVDAIFVSMTATPFLAERISNDTGAQIVYLYTGSLSEPGGEAGTYLDYMRFNTNAIIEALR